MKYLLLIPILLSLLSCDAEEKLENENEKLTFNDVDLTGTWILTREEKRFQKNTNEYLNSTIYEDTYIIEETNEGVKFNPCHVAKHWNAQYVNKTDSYLYTEANQIDGEGFILIDENTIERVLETEIEGYENTIFEMHIVLKKISDEILLDHGTLILNGKYSTAQYDHVCIEKSYSNDFEGQWYSIISPINDQFIQFTFSFDDDIKMGTYSSSEELNDNFVSLIIASNEEEFIEKIGSNAISIQELTVNIIELNDSTLNGNFTATDYSDDIFTGEFEIDL